MLEKIAEFIVSAIGLTGSSASALEFWIYDSLKIVIILFLVIFAVSYFRTYLPPEKIRDFLEGKNVIIGYVLAALLGVVSPFCSCSTIPLFLGFVAAGIPFGMIITFLFVSPMVNEAAIFVLFGTLGFEITLAYVLGGILVGMVGSLLLSRLGFRKYLKSFNFSSDCACEDDSSKKDRLKMAYTEGKNIVRTVIPYVLIGVGIGAVIHGYVPQETITSYLTGQLAVPIAVVVGVPIYTNIMGVIPVVESLISKGLPIGTSLSFMMSVAALSLPQFIMLKKVMKKELITAYAIILSVGIIIVGLIFNVIF